MEFCSSTNGMLELGKASGAVKMVLHLIEEENKKYKKQNSPYNYDYVFELLWDLGRVLEGLETYRIPE